MRELISFLMLACVLVTTSCKQDKKIEEDQTQMEEVMAIHDEVMPKMGIIGNLVGELRPKVDTTEAGQRYEKAMKDLQDANTAMMDWMRDFGNQFDYQEIMNGKELSEEKRQLLTEEEEKVKVVKEKINGSIERARALLAKDTLQ